MELPPPKELDAYHELCCITLGLGDEAFVHQHVVDAWAAQNAELGDPPMGLAFSLFGLHLHLERGFSGRQVQRAHMALARRKRAWPAFELPSWHGECTVLDVLAAGAGPALNSSIDAWCTAVWRAHAANHALVAATLRSMEPLER